MNVVYHPFNETVSEALAIVAMVPTCSMSRQSFSGKKLCRLGDVLFFVFFSSRYQKHWMIEVGTSNYGNIWGFVWFSDSLLTDRNMDLTQKCADLSYNLSGSKLVSPFQCKPIIISIAMLIYTYTQSCNHIIYIYILYYSIWRVSGTLHDKFGIQRMPVSWDRLDSRITAFIPISTPVAMKSFFLIMCMAVLEAVVGEGHIWVLVENTMADTVSDQWSVS